MSIQHPRRNKPLTHARYYSALVTVIICVSVIANALVRIFA